MMLRTLLCTWFLSFVLSFYGNGQNPYFRDHPLPLEFKKADVTCVLQDHNYFIWLGTSVGLIRFDGNSYEHYERLDKSNHISALYQDSHHVLWIGFQDGSIEKFQNGKFHAVSQIKQPVSSPITGIVEGSNNEMWFSTYGEGLVFVSTDTAYTFAQNHGLSDNFVYAIVRDENNHIVAGTDRGISVCSRPNNKTEVEIINTDHGLPDNIVTSLTYRSGKLWIGTESQGVCSLDLTTRKWQYPVQTWTRGRATSILPLEETIWIGTAMHGVVEADIKGKFVTDISKTDKSLPLRVNDITMDSEGNIWIAGPGNIHSGNRTFTFLTHFEGKQLDNVQAILYSREGTIWYSTNQGVFFTKDVASGTPKHLDLPDLKGIQVISLYQDPDGYIWFGTFDAGVFRYDLISGNMLQVTEKNGLINNNVLSIAGKDDELWFATLGGVSQCKVTENKNGKPEFVFNNYTSEHGLGSNYIYKIFVDTQGKIWFATDGKGVTVYENGEFKNYSLNEGLKSNIIYSVTEDASQKIWISTSNAGIYHLEGNSFKPFMPRNGLRDLSISAIIGEKNGNILVVSPQGIDILDPITGVVYYHGQEFGIADIDPNLNAYTIDSIGNIWLGTQSGIVKYNTNIPPMQKWPVTRINEVQIFLAAIDSTQKKFRFNQNHVSFDYMGFWYHDPAEVTYRLKLEGYDLEWVTSKNHFITYPNLPPGDYCFMVQASATTYFDGIPVRKFAFTILPPFYNTAWFYGLLAVSGAVLLFWFVKARERKLRAREKTEKDKIRFQLETLKNQVNPHFLFNSFNTLIGVIEEDKETAVAYVEKLSDFYRQILLSREKDVIPLSQELELLENYYFLQLKRFKKNFKLNVDIPDDKHKFSIPPLTLQLLVENALKHNIVSNDKPLIIDIRVENDYLIVRNNLQRKAAYESSTGLGLSNIMNRFRLLTNKKVVVHETPEYFVVSVPLLDF